MVLTSHKHLGDIVEDRLSSVQITGAAKKIIQPGHKGK
jgi:hypothetical protein